LQRIRSHGTAADAGQDVISGRDRCRVHNIMCRLSMPRCQLTVPTH